MFINLSIYTQKLIFEHRNKQDLYMDTYTYSLMSMYWVLTVWLLRSKTSSFIPWNTLECTKEKKQRQYEQLRV